MKVNNTTFNYNPNFNALLISTYKDEWDKKALKKFVKNKEVYKLVDLYSWQGKDIEAHYIAPKSKSDSAKIRLCEFDEDNFPGKLITDIKVSQLRRFFGFSVKNFLKSTENNK